MKRRHLIFLSALIPLLAPVLTSAEKGDYSHLGREWREYSDLEEKPEWAESTDIRVPTTIRDEDLHQLEVFGSSRFSYFLDRSSLSVGKDHVIRYVVVVKSETGTARGSYEGIRCDDKEYKVYAYTRADGRFYPLKKTKWRRLSRSRAEQHRAYLAEDLFCDAFDVPQRPQDILGMLDGKGETIRYMDKDEIR